MKRYVLGFAVSVDKESVLLVKKTKGPEINLDKWNGIGGKVESTDSSALEAMHREWKEETTFDSDIWVPTGAFVGDLWHISIFTTMFNSHKPTPEHNDVGELLEWKGCDEVLDPGSEQIWAENVAVMLQHILTGTGSMVLTR